MPIDVDAQEWRERERLHRFLRPSKCVSSESVRMPRRLLDRARRPYDAQEAEERAQVKVELAQRKERSTSAAEGLEMRRERQPDSVNGLQRRLRPTRAQTVPQVRAGLQHSARADRTLALRQRALPGIRLSRRVLLEVRRGVRYCEGRLAAQAGR